MSKKIPEMYLQAIERIVASNVEGVGIALIQKRLGDKLSKRTLQYRLNHMVREGRLVKVGDKRWTRYKLAAEYGAGTIEIPEKSAPHGFELPLSIQARKVQIYVQMPVAAREPKGYQREFLEGYRPNKTPYFTAEELTRLRQWGAATHVQQAAGTYARQILTRLLIDLSWSSSKLEGNTYSLLDTRRLIDFGEAADGKQQLEAQMILNHKEAIEFLVNSAEDIGFNRHTILNLHGLLANNLLADPGATGRLRKIAVGIDGSTFHPLEVPQIIEECFDQVLATADSIEDPFEQALFIMVQLPYLQPFDDVNKRVSRLAANIPLIKANLEPLSFNDLPNHYYTEAILGVYELNDVSLLKSVFMWCYERSAGRYKAVRQSMGEPDPFRLKYKVQLREIVRAVILGGLDRKSAYRHIAAWAQERINAEDREGFREMAEDELLGLHAGNFARYQIRPSEFAIWQKLWTAPR